KAYLEWEFLDGLEMIARVPLMPIKRALQSAVIPAMNLYENLLVLETPVVTEKVSADVGQRNGVDGPLFPRLLRHPSLPLLQMPVTREPRQLRDPSRSQLVRATTPWVQYWRLPLLRWGEKTVLLARFKCYYLRWSNEFTLLLCRRAKEDQGVNLFI